MISRRSCLDEVSEAEILALVPSLARASDGDVPAAARPLLARLAKAAGVTDRDDEATTAQKIAAFVDANAPRDEVKRGFIVARRRDGAQPCARSEERARGDRAVRAKRGLCGRALLGAALHRHHEPRALAALRAPDGNDPDDVVLDVVHVVDVLLALTKQRATHAAIASAFELKSQAGYRGQELDGALELVEELRATGAVGVPPRRLPRRALRRSACT